MAVDRPFTKRPSVQSIVRVISDTDRSAACARADHRAIAASAMTL